MINIGGITKLTLLDYPQHTACTIFVNGCNMRCPFCHNARLVDNESAPVSLDEVFSFLQRRRSMLDGVVISGGEPTLYNDIVDVITHIKQLGYLVKLDTNGSNYDMLHYLVSNHLVDYVAMDIKNSLDKYPLTTGTDNIDIATIVKSIRYLIEGHVDYEFRTTVVAELHQHSDFDSIGNLLMGAKKYYLQQFVDNGNNITQGLTAVDSDTLREYANIASKYITLVGIRGI